MLAAGQPVRHGEGAKDAAESECGLEASAGWHDKKARCAMSIERWLWLDMLGRDTVVIEEGRNRRASDKGKWSIFYVARVEKRWANVRIGSRRASLCCLSCG